MMLLTVLAAMLTLSVSTSYGQGLAARADTLGMVTAAARAASHDLLSPERSLVLAQEPHGTRGAYWDSTTTAALRGALSNGRAISVVRCGTTEMRCRPNATTQVMFIGVPSANGDSAEVEVAVTQAATGLTPMRVVVRSKIYVLAKRAGVWTVDHVRLNSAT